ncbi:MAG: hypothetical protein PHH03_10030 [Eubacteriales bacterium]|nr:hypothetical protein [Eubacteriales bacterium]
MRPINMQSKQNSDHDQQKKKAMWILVCVVLFIIGMIGAIVFKSWPVKVLFLVIALLAAFYFAKYRPETHNQKAEPEEKAEPRKPILPPTEKRQRDASESASEAISDQEAAKPQDTVDDIVYVSEKGTKFHKEITCAGLKFADLVEKVSKDAAIAANKTPCKLCHTDKG